MTVFVSHFADFPFFSSPPITGEYRHWRHQRQFPDVRVEHCENFGAGECWARDSIVRRVGERSWLRQEWLCHLSFIQRRLGALIKRKSRHIEFNFIHDDVEQSLQHRCSDGSFNLIAASRLWNLTTSYVNCYRNGLRWAGVVEQPYDFGWGTRRQRQFADLRAEWIHHQSIGVNAN